MVTPTLTPAPAVLPSPTVVAVATPPTEMTRPGPTTVFVFGGAVLLLAAAVFGVALLLLRQRRPPPKPKVTPPKPGPAGSPPGSGQAAPLPEKRGLLTSVRPQPGIPCLESRNRPGGTLYCSLTQPAVTIGRGAENDLVIDDSFPGWQTVSRRHALVEYNGARAVVVDQAAANGVYVNGQRTGANVLQDGWTVGFGQVEFTYRVNRGGGAQ